MLGFDTEASRVGMKTLRAVFAQRGTGTSYREERAQAGPSRPEPAFLWFVVVVWFGLWSCPLPALHPFSFSFRVHRSAGLAVKE